jgi:Carboxypeptidase regulatory-like domain
MLKRKLIADSMIIAVLLVFAFQIGMFGFTTASRKNVTGIVYGSSGVPLSSASVFVSGSEGSGYTTTDGTGHYLISDGLPAGNYTVGAIKLGYVDTEVKDVIITAGHQTTLDLYMNRSGGIKGKVTDSSTSNPIPNIDVFAMLSSGGGTFFGSGITDVAGNYEINMNLGTGTYNVSVTFPKGFVSKMVSGISVVAGIITTGVNLALDRSGIISGLITAFPGGQPIANASITAFSGGGMTYFGTDTTDATGHYSISSGLGTGNYTVFASYQLSFNQTLNVAVTAGQETSNVNMKLTLVSPPPPTFSGTITGRVTNATGGQPIADAHVVADGDTTFSSASNDTDANGYYIIAEDLDTDTYTVTASAFGYQDANLTSVSVTVNQTTPNVNLQLTKIPTAQSGSISGTVTGDANPIPEFEYPIAIMMIITLAGVVVAKLSTRKIKPY